jgi:glucosyl-3-phosphoglycerate synthase
MKELLQTLRRAWGRQRAAFEALLFQKKLAPAATALQARAAEPPPPISWAVASVVIPALNEAERVGDVVRYALSDPATAEVIVVDDSSTDDTVERARAAGASVITSSMLGKGASMRDGVQVAKQPLVVFLDGDLAQLQPGIVTALCTPLLEGRADFVKARFGRGGGRVTELTAKPMLSVFFPELAHFAQPLGGIIGARRALLQQLGFENGYGVDIGLLIGAHRRGARLREVDIGSLEHDSQPLGDLTSMANEVAQVIYTQARHAGRLHMEQIAAMYESQRQATASIHYILSKRRGRRRILLLDMDGTITPTRYALEVAKATGALPSLNALLDTATRDTAGRSAQIASLFRFVHRQQFEATALNLPIREGLVACVNQMRRMGFMVGVVSDSYFIAAEVIRRRIFADFAMAHTLNFENDICTGEVRLNGGFFADAVGRSGNPCKSEVLKRFREDRVDPRVSDIWAVGDNVNDLQMLCAADRAFVIDPKAPHLARDSDATVLKDFFQLANAARANTEPAR